MHPIYLGINIDHIATLRQARGTPYPEPLQAALLAEQAGADSITVHLREDRRHIQDRDVELLADTLQTRMNLEMAVTDEMLAIAERIGPACCCLVPEKREELTTEGGLDVLGQQTRIGDACARLADAGIEVSLFVDADPQQLEACAAIGVPVIELHTGHYADASDRADREQHYQALVRAANLARELGLQVNAGHGLHYHNVQPIAAISVVHELNIGHGVIARALFTGLEEAVREMKRLMCEARQHGRADSIRL